MVSFLLIISTNPFPMLSLSSTVGVHKISFQWVSPFWCKMSGKSFIGWSTVSSINLSSNSMASCNWLTCFLSSSVFLMLVDLIVESRLFLDDEDLSMLGKLARIERWLLRLTTYLLQALKVLDLSLEMLLFLRASTFCSLSRWQPSKISFAMGPINSSITSSAISSTISGALSNKAKVRETWAISCFAISFDIAAIWSSSISSAMSSMAWLFASKARRFWSSSLRTSFKTSLAKLPIISLTTSFCNELHTSWQVWMIATFFIISWPMWIPSSRTISTINSSLTELSASSRALLALIAATSSGEGLGSIRWIIGSGCVFLSTSLHIACASGFK